MQQKINGLEILPLRPSQINIGEVMNLTMQKLEHLLAKHNINFSSQLTFLQFNDTISLSQHQILEPLAASNYYAFEISNLSFETDIAFHACTVTDYYQQLSAGVPNHLLKQNLRNKHKWKLLHVLNAHHFSISNLSEKIETIKALNKMCFLISNSDDPILLQLTNALLIQTIAQNCQGLIICSDQPDLKPAESDYFNIWYFMNQSLVAPASTLNIKTALKKIKAEINAYQKT